MRYPAAEKADIIQLVEQSHMPPNHCKPSLAAPPESSLNFNQDEPEPPFENAAIVSNCLTMDKLFCEVEVLG